MNLIRRSSDSELAPGLKDCRTPRCKENEKLPPAGCWTHQSRPERRKAHAILIPVLPVWIAQFMQDSFNKLGDFRKRGKCNSRVHRISYLQRCLWLGFLKGYVTAIQRMCKCRFYFRNCWSGICACKSRNKIQLEAYSFAENKQLTILM